MAKAQTANETQSDLFDLGAFWKKSNDGGKTGFLSGKVTIGGKEYTAFVFPNKKGKDTHPDYRLRVAGYDPNATTAAAEPAADVGGDDIPF